MADIVLKVSPDTLKEKASNIQNNIKKIETAWIKIENTMHKTRNYWQGDASKLQQKYRIQIDDDWTYIIKRLKEHPEDLLEMAGVYKEAEKTTTQIANSLPGDVIY